MNEVTLISRSELKERATESDYIGVAKKANALTEGYVIWIYASNQSIDDKPLFCVSKYISSDIKLYVKAEAAIRDAAKIGLKSLTFEF
ncbi:hypothetical protein [Photobacterium leiognathi]|uniref:hypothetical protein n=1 Tax=Photobacterium leiognathi TaxID=553611 RepID=UPI0029818FAF|nr:hypothetical protein [Photobacterium leiognathi]